MLTIITGNLRSTRVGIPLEIKNFDVAPGELRALGNQEGIMVGR